MIKFIIISWIITIIITKIKAESLRGYWEDNNIELVEEYNMADKVLAIIRLGIPIFNWLVIGVALFVENEILTKMGLENGSLRDNSVVE
jgi:hypothetical protein